MPNNVVVISKATQDANISSVRGYFLLILKYPLKICIFLLCVVYVSLYLSIAWYCLCMFSYNLQVGFFSLVSFFPYFAP